MAAAIGAVRGFGDWLAGLGVEAFHGHLSCQRDNGVPLTLEVSAGRVPDGAGGATCLLLEFDRDRVATEAQRYFDVAFDAAPIGMALFNTDGEYVRVNRALCALLGRSEAQLLGRRDQEFTHPDDRQTRCRRRLAHPAGGDQHLADREAVRPPRRLAWCGRSPTSRSCATTTETR